MSRTPIRPLTLLAALAACLALAGCSKNSPTQPSATAQQDADDAAYMVGLSLAQDVAGDPATQGAPGATSQPPLATHAQAATADTTFTAGFVTWTLGRTFYNAAGTEQGSYNPLTTTRMDATARGVGQVSTATDTASFGSAALLQVRGLAAAQDTFVADGARHDTLLTSFWAPVRQARVHTYVEGAEALAAVRQLKPVDQNPWPLSGTATWTLAVDRLATSDRGSVQRHYASTVVVTFNGTRYVGVIVDGAFHYTLDLKTGQVVRA